MATYSGGSIDSLSVAGRDFAIDAKADVRVNAGGRNQRREPYGDGTGRVIWSRSNWSMVGLQVAANLDADDVGFLRDLRATVPVTLTLVSGHFYEGKGSIAGSVELATAQGLIPLGIEGDGKLSLTAPGGESVLGAILDAIADLF